MLKKSHVKLKRKTKQEKKKSAKGKEKKEEEQEEDVDLEMYMEEEESSGESMETSGPTTEVQEEFTKRYEKGVKEGAQGEITIGFVEYLMLHLATQKDLEEVEWFQSLLCAGQDPTIVLKSLCYDSVSHSICGAKLDEKRWQYECKTCQHDDTCVICADCFLDGNHEGHKIKRVKVTDGTCDCGDPESWEPSGFCKRHKGPASDADFRSIPSDILPSAATAFAGVIDVILIAAAQIDATYLFPKNLYKTESDSELWGTILYNDDFHQFEEVIHALMEANPAIQKKQAENFALRVDALV